MLTSPLRAYRVVSRSAAAGHRQLVLGVAKPLLRLPPVGGRLAALDGVELRLRGLELLARAGVVDLRGLDGVVDQRDRPVVQHLEEAGARRELEHLGAPGR